MPNEKTLGTFELGEYNKETKKSTVVGYGMITLGKSDKGEYQKVSVQIYGIWYSGFYRKSLTEEQKKKIQEIRNQ